MVVDRLASGRVKSPMIRRFYALLAALIGVLVTPAQANARPSADVEDVVRAALAHPELEDRLRARVDAARAEIDEATVTPTPTLGLAYDRVFGDLDVGAVEFSAMVEQRFDLSGWRGALREALPHRESAQRAELDSARLATATTVREAFFRVRYREERLAALDAWSARLARGLAGIRARQERGDASPYQARRAARELELVDARRASEASALAEAWADLERWTAWEERPRLVGEVPPARTAARPEAEAPPRRPELARLRHLERALDAEAGAWGSPLWRGWSVGVGYRYAEVGPSVGHGLLLTLSAPLALWNTDAARVQRLRARRAEVSSELALRTGLANREADAAGARLDAALRSLEALSEPSRDAELSHLAQLAFDAGEASLIELLDAFGSEVDLQLARLDLQWEARRAAIALDRARGLGAPP